MQGIISLLDDQTDRMIREIWHLISESIGIDPAENSHVPHVSWHVAEEYPFDLLHERVDQMARKLKPFPLISSGLGIFRTPAKVLYVALTITPEILDIQKQLYDQVNSICKEPNPCYRPGLWVPHITLAHHHIEMDQLGVLYEKLQPFQLERKILIDNFSIFCPKQDGEIEICSSHFTQPEVIHGS